MERTRAGRQGRSEEGSFLLSFVAMGVAAIAVVLGIGAVARVGNASTVKESAPIAVTLREFAIEPAMIMASPGKVTLQVTNTGTMTHNFKVTGLGNTKDLKPGESASLALADVKAGSYEVLCTVPGHEASGMKATLMVAVGATAGANPAAAPPDTMTPAQMDKSMADVAGKYLDVQSGKIATKGTGNQELAPVVEADGTKVFNLTAKVVDWETEPGKVVKAWTYNGQVPGPIIRVSVGDKVKVVLKNELPESTSVHFHGIRVPNAMDGVDPYTQDPILPGATFTYAFTALENSVGMYHSHHDAQVQVPNGLAGAFLIGDWKQSSLDLVKTMKRPPAISSISQEVVMVLNDAGTIGLSLNGKSFPATAAYAMKVGDTMLVHYMNEGLMTHPMHLHQPHGLVVARDGVLLDSPYYADTISVAPGERWSVLYTALDPGVWAWHCHILNHAETPTGMIGMVTALIVT